VASEASTGQLDLDCASVGCGASDRGGCDAAQPEACLAL